MGGGVTTSVNILSYPTKLNYKEGENLSLDGLSLSLSKFDNSNKIVESYISIPANNTKLKRTDNEVIIRIKDEDSKEFLYTSFNINIKYPVGIEIFSIDKKNYSSTDTVDLSGLKMMLLYNDGSKELITDVDNITSTPANGSIIGEYKHIEFSYTKNDEVFKTIFNIRDVLKSLDLNATREYIRNKLCTWAGGSWDEIYGMVKLSRDNIINLKDYWKVGDEKIVWSYLVKNEDTVLDRNNALSKNLKYSNASFDPSIQTKLVILDITKNFRKNLYGPERTYYGEIVFTTKTLSHHSFMHISLNNLASNAKNVNIYPSIVNNLSCYDGHNPYNIHANITKNINDYEFINQNLTDDSAYGTRFGYYASIEKPKDTKSYTALKLTDNMFNNIGLLSHAYYLSPNSVHITGINEGDSPTFENGIYIYKKANIFIRNIINYGSNDKYNYSKFSLPLKNEIFGENALEYYKTKSNKIPEVYFGDNFSSGWGYKYVGYLLGDFNYQGLGSDAFNTSKAFPVTLHKKDSIYRKIVFKDPNIKLRFNYVNKEGELTEADPFNNNDLNDKLVAYSPIFVM